MKNIVTALMQFVILVVALVIVTFAIPKIAGNDDRYDKYIAENSKQAVTVGSAFGVVKDGEKASYTDIDNSLKNIFSKVTPLQKPVNKVLNKQISFKQAKYFEYYWLTALISGVLCWIFAAGFPFRIGRKGFNVFGSVYNNFSKVVLLEDEMTREEYEVDLGMTIWGPLWIILIDLCYYMGLYPAFCDSRQSCHRHYKNSWKRYYCQRPWCCRHCKKAQPLAKA